MADSIEDPVSSPDTSTQSSPVEPQVESSQTPTPVGSDSPAPPAASDHDPATPSDDAEQAIASEEEILARLQGHTPKQDTKEKPPSDVTPAKESEEVAAEANPETPEPEKEFSFPDEKELAGYHSRTRDRMKQIIGKAKEQAPYAQYGKALLDQAQARGITNEQLNAWNEVAFLVREGNRDALPVLANVLKQAGYKDKDLAPEGEPGLDATALDTMVDKALEEGDITPSAALAFKAALKPKAKAPEKPATQPEAKTLRQDPPVDHRMVALTDINHSRAEFAAEYGPRWKQLEPAINAEIQRVESLLSPAERDNPALWPRRYIRVAERVLNRPATPTPSVTPSLRANSAPTPQNRPQPGTAEYEEGLLMGRIAVR